MRIGSLLAMAITASICVSALSTARAANVVDLAADLKQAVGSWALDTPSGAPVLILNTNDGYTLRPTDRATPADRRWASQVRQSMILAQHAGISVNRPVIAQASFGVWEIRFEKGLSIAAASAAEAISYLLCSLFEHVPAEDLDAITSELIDQTGAVPQVTAGTTATTSILPHIVSAESTDPGITVSIAPHTGLAQVNATQSVAPGYYQLSLYDSVSRFSPTASMTVEIVDAESVY